MIRTILFFILFNSAFYSFAQSFNQEKVFAEYLFNNKLYDESILQLKIINKKYQLDKIQQDSINYYLGKIFYNSQNDSALFYFNNVEIKNTAIYNESCLFLANIFSCKGEYAKAKKKISEINSNDTLVNQTKEIISVSSQLLARDTSQLIIKPMICKDFFYPVSELKDCKNKISLIKKKSPVVAGLLSAVLPGLGKVYVGKPLHGLASFISVVVFGAQAYEGYRKCGIESTRFIFYGSLFSLFYVGNIWGSILSVQIKKQEINDQINHQIIVAMQIPMDKLFARSK